MTYYAFAPTILLSLPIPPILNVATKSPSKEIIKRYSVNAR